MNLANFWGVSMKIDLTWLKSHPHETREYYWKQRIDDITLAGQPIRFEDYIKVQLSLTNTGRFIVGPGTIKTVLGLQCGKCLQPYSFPLEVDFHVQLCEADPGHGAREEDCIVFKGNEVDLGPIILENIIVNLPLKQVCREDCPGFCPRCGADLGREKCRCQDEEIDPRWDVLRRLL